MTTRLRQRYGGWAWQAGVALFLVLLLAATWGLKTRRVAEVRNTVQQEQREAVQKALTFIKNDFFRLERSVRRRARKLASHPTVVRGMRAFVRDDQDGGGRPMPEKLVKHFEALDLGSRMAVELYDPTPRLVTWNGLGMPLDRAPNTAGFLQAPQTAIARDGNRREALAAWWPVRDGPRVVGAVRLLRTIRYRPPVDNRYLESHDLAKRWERATNLSVEVRLGRKETEPEREAPRRVLRGADSTRLGVAWVHPPSPDQLVGATAARYDNVLAFWGVLLLFWSLSVLWSWYRKRRSTRQTERPVHEQLQRGLLPAVAVVAGIAGARYALLALNAPNRWQTGEAPLAPLFDPGHLASALGNGLFRSTGDLLVTALACAALGLVVLHVTWPFRKKGAQLFRLRERLAGRSAERPSLLRFLTTPVAAGVVVGSVSYGLAKITRQVLLDSKLRFFAREDLVPDPLVLVVFCALLLISAAAVALVVGTGWVAFWLLMRYRPDGWSPRALAAAGGLAFAAPLLAGYAFMLRGTAPAAAVAALVVIGGVLAVAGFLPDWGPARPLTLRNVLLGIFLVTVMLYPMLDSGLDVQRRQRMRYVATSFADQQDPRVTFALRRVLQKTQARLALANPARMTRSTRDSLANELLRGSLLSSLSLYDISLTLFTPAGRPIGRSLLATGRAGNRLQQVDSMEFSVVHQMYEESGARRPFVERITGRRQRDRFQYVGITPLYTAGRKDGTPAAWAMVRAAPQTPLREGSNAFPRVLLPAGLNPSPYANLSLATFRGRALVRSFGRDFGRYRLDASVAERLLTRQTFWRFETVKDQRYLTFYRRYDPKRANPSSPAAAQSPARVVGVRMPAFSTFDHLYFLLRLTVAGLLIGIPVFLWGLYRRYRMGELPARRVRFRDKILNAFLGVGLVTVTAVGVVGLQVVTGENKRATQSWLRQYLDRVKETLAREAASNEMPYRVLNRVRIDSLAAQVGLDLNLYTRNRLVATSRPQLVRENLIDRRLPIEAVEALYYDGYRYTFVRERVGTFTYTTGFRALLDEEGRPRYVVAVPTLPEQERIEEERARTVAYLFGSLLLLLIVVMLTAALLARALTRPLSRLRSGLEAVARGRFEHPIPVSTRDEIGELVETFNAMQEQLAESRRKLARQERKLAWREMARQVAHEIKNPLTPMKLSVQHLRRAFERVRERVSDEDDERGRFQSVFERITSTLIEQIETLASIANEFHSFARMPPKTPEALDLNDVVQEATSLMKEEKGAVDIEDDLADDSLVVHADREELRRIYINLIKNGIQAVPEERAGRIEVATRREDGDGEAPGWAVSRVADNGVGIAEDLRDKIFEPNFSTKTSGTGLGLAITDKGISDMGGEIRFETEEGEGTTFIIRLPLAESARGEAGDGESGDC
jgi:signal transduction histidine kinase